MEPYPALLQEERIARKRSLILTLLILASLFLIAYFWVLVRDTVPPSDENPYIIAGRIDFGNMTSGSANQNNFNPPGQQSPQPPVEKPQPQVSNPEEIVSANETGPTSMDSLPAKQPTQKTEEMDPSLLFEYTEGGSNEGASGTIGNEGTPYSPVLDPEGLFQFGSGEMGLKGRIPISLPKPEYRVNKETRITYEFIIAPDGHVKSVRPLTFSTATELVEAGKEAIYKWRFNPIPENKDQKARVTITFKLK